jgi:hypothetical protein
MSDLDRRIERYLAKATADRSCLAALRRSLRNILAQMNNAG